MDDTTSYQQRHINEHSESTYDTERTKERKVDDRIALFSESFKFRPLLDAIPLGEWNENVQRQELSDERPNDEVVRDEEEILSSKVINKDGQKHERSRRTFGPLVYLGASGGESRMGYEMKMRGSNGLST